MHDIRCSGTLSAVARGRASASLHYPSLRRVEGRRHRAPPQTLLPLIQRQSRQSLAEVGSSAPLRVRYLLHTGYRRRTWHVSQAGQNAQYICSMHQTRTAHARHAPRCRTLGPRYAQLSTQCCTRTVHGLGLSRPSFACGSSSHPGARRGPPPVRGR